MEPIFVVPSVLKVAVCVGVYAFYADLFAESCLALAILLALHILRRTKTDLF